MKAFFTVFIFSLFITGCVRQVVYQSSINLPKEQLKEGDYDLKFGIAMLPESRMVDNKFVEPGVFFDVGFGFRENINFNFNYWIAHDVSSTVKWGISMGSYINLIERTNYDLLLYPRIGFVANDIYYRGQGFEIPLILNYRFTKYLYAYGGIGFAMGIYKFEEIEDDGHKGIPYGYGYIGHFGGGYYFTDKFRCTVEINPIYVKNKFDQLTAFAVSPNFCLAYTF